MAIGDKIKSARLEARMTLEDVAQRVGVTRQTVQKYESGIVSNIPSDRIELLAKALNVTPAYLMGWEDTPVSTKPAYDIFSLPGVSRPPRMIKNPGLAQSPAASPSLQWRKPKSMTMFQKISNAILRCAARGTV